MARKKKKIIIDKRSKETKDLDYMKMHRKISRELQIESGVRYKSATFRDRTKYDRKVRKQQDRKETFEN